MFAATLVFSFGVSHSTLADIRVQPRTAAGVATGPLLTPTLLNDGLGRYTGTLTLPDDARTVLAFSLAAPAVSCVRVVAPPVQAAPIPPGADTLTCRFVIDDTHPVADADAWLTRDAAGTQVVDRGRTDTDGDVKFLVDGYVSPGAKRAFYFFAQKDGIESRKAVVVYCD